jgi:NAD(P)-dependent dehydrogenase (short-subunit alcohol dehydrogenase family)
MKDLEGKVAVVTGGGSGIGRGIVLALAEAGTHVVVADIDERAATAVAAEATALGPPAVGVLTDVTDLGSVEALAARAWDEFGAVHVLCNNAGVVLTQRLDDTTPAEWEWIRSINLDGVMHGLQTFLPRWKDQAGRKHIVNTASMAGMTAGPNLGAYNATKFAVVAISETLASELADQDVGVSVLCPGGVRTNIMANGIAQRPEGGAALRQLELATALVRMADPDDVGRLVRRAIEEDEFYIFTHPEFAPAVQHRFGRILASFERAAERQAPDGT